MDNGELRGSGEKLPGCNNRQDIKEAYLRFGSVKILESTCKFSPLPQVFLLRFIRALLRPLKYRGFGMATKLLGRLVFRSQNAVIVRVHQRSRFKIYLDDPYWFLLLTPGYIYEKETALVLAKSLRSNCFFIDCGANAGYWSIMATEYIAEPSRIIAIEAGAMTYARLMENRFLNNEGFSCVQAAVDAEAGKQVEFVTVGSNHAGAAIRGMKKKHNRTDTRVERVTTTTLDEICENYLPHDNDAPLIVKLDVEGAEVNALRGAKGLRAKDVLLIYEDLGGAVAENVSRYVLEEFDMNVYYFDETGTSHKCEGKEDLATVMAEPGKAYNFFACRSGSMFEPIFMKQDKH